MRTQTHPRNGHAVASARTRERARTRVRTHTTTQPHTQPHTHTHTHPYTYTYTYTYTHLIHKQRRDLWMPAVHVFIFISCGEGRGGGGIFSTKCSEILWACSEILWAAHKHAHADADADALCFIRFARGFKQFEPATNFLVSNRCQKCGDRTTDKQTFHHGGGFNLNTSLFTTTCISRITRTSYNHEKHGSRNAATQPVPAPSERNRSGKPVQYGRCDAWQRHVKQRR